MLFLSLFACSPAAPEVSFADIYPAFESDCATCHNADNTYQPSLHLDDASSAYASLLDGTPTDLTAFDAYVVPGDPDASALLDKLGAEPTFGGYQMPVSGTYPDYVVVPWSDEQIQLVRDWIEAGAPE